MSYLQGFLLQVLIYAALWVYSDYLGLLIGIIMSAIIAGLLIFSSIVELIEKSKVPRSFFKWMFISLLAPLIVMGLFGLIYEFQFDWLNE
jgi:hypothetical protein